MVVLALATAIVATPAAQSKAEVTLRAAREAEAVKGDLKKAAALYEQAVAEAGAKGPVAAQALVGPWDDVSEARTDGGAGRVCPRRARLCRSADGGGGGEGGDRHEPPGGCFDAAQTMTSRATADGRLATVIFEVSADGQWIVGSDVGGPGWQRHRPQARPDRPSHRSRSGLPTGKRVPGSHLGRRRAHRLHLARAGQQRLVRGGQRFHSGHGDHARCVTGDRLLSAQPTRPPLVPLDWSADGREILAVQLRRPPAPATFMMIDAGSGAARDVKTLEPGRVPLL